MADLLNNPVALIFGSIMIMTVGGTVAQYVFKYYAMRLEADLKMEMIQRGMSAGDVERVLAARSNRKAPASRASADSLSQAADHKN